MFHEIVLKIISDKHIIYFSTKAILVTLTIDLVNPKSIGFLSSRVKYESLVINRSETIWSTNGRTDGQTDPLTDISKTICPLFFEGGIT